MLPRDMQRILKIRDYCLLIQEDVRRFGVDQDDFLSDVAYQHSVAFKVAQIGELTAGLTEEYKNETEDRMEWPRIKGLRNIIVHDYGKVKLEKLWKIITDDIPTLKAFCNDQLPPEYRQDD